MLKFDSMQKIEKKKNLISGWFEAKTDFGTFFFVLTQKSKAACRLVAVYSNFIVIYRAKICIHFKNVNKSTFTFVKNKANRIDRLTKNAKKIFVALGSFAFALKSVALNDFKVKMNKNKRKKRKKEEFGHYKTSKATRIVWKLNEKHIWKYIVATSMYSVLFSLVRPSACLFVPLLLLLLVACLLMYTQSHIDSYVTCHAHTGQTSLYCSSFSTRTKKRTLLLIRCSVFRFNTRCCRWDYCRDFFSSLCVSQCTLWPLFV